MSSYTGLYVQRMDNGKIHSVQVEDPAGNGLPLDPDQYVARGVQPPIDDLLDLDLYVAAKRGASHVLVTLVRWIRKQKVSAGQIENLQRFGYLHYDPQGKLTISESAVHDLSEAGLRV